VGNFADHILRLRNLTGNEQGSYVNMNTGSDLYFSAVTYSPYSTPQQATIFIGNQQGKVFKVENINSVPVVNEIGSSGFPVGNVSCIAVGGSEDTLVATFSNYGVPSVWVSTNGGQNWADVETNLPDMPIRWALIHPDNSRNVMLATETGVWMTEDILAATVSWEPATDGMGNVRTDMLRIRKTDNTVLAAGHGRGLFTTTWDAVVGIPERGFSQMEIYPNPVREMVNVSLDVETPTVITIELINTKGQVLFSEDHQVSGKIIISKVLAKYPAGIYFITLKSAGKTIASEKIIKL
jgi:hypothetical protein